MSADLPTHAESVAARDIGIASAAASVSCEWARRALGYVREFAAYADGPFLVEQIREFADAGGFDEPRNAKAWGPVIQEARRQKIIRPCGFAPARSSHRSPKVLWTKT